MKYIVCIFKRSVFTLQMTTVVWMATLSTFFCSLKNTGPIAAKLGRNVP